MTRTDVSIHASCGPQPLEKMSVSAPKHIHATSRSSYILWSECTYTYVICVSPCRPVQMTSFQPMVHRNPEMLLIDDHLLFLLSLPDISWQRVSQIQKHLQDLGLNRSFQIGFEFQDTLCWYQRVSGYIAGEQVHTSH